MESLESSSINEIAKEFRNSTQLSRISIEVRAIDITIDRDRYVSMKECLCCQASLGKQASKKYFCHFCYGAVCTDCSMLEIYHPETRKNERSCNNCYLENLKAKVLEISEEFINVKMKEEIAEKEREAEERKKIMEMITLTRKNSEKSKEILRAKLSGTENDIQARAAKVRQQEEKNEKMKKYIEKLVREGTVSVNEYKKLYPNDVPPQTHSSNCLKCSVF